MVRIANVVETESRTVEARVEVNNADGRLKPGMFADVEIVTTVLQDVMVIPDSALQTEEDNQIVFVALDGNKFQKRVGEAWNGAARPSAGARRIEDR